MFFCSRIRDSNRLGTCRRELSLRVLFSWDLSRLFLLLLRLPAETFFAFLSNLHLSLDRCGLFVAEVLPAEGKQPKLFKSASAGGICKYSPKSVRFSMHSENVHQCDPRKTKNRAPRNGEARHNGGFTRFSRDLPAQYTSHRFLSRRTRHKTRRHWKLCRLRGIPPANAGRSANNARQVRRAKRFSRLSNRKGRTAGVP